MYKNHEGYSDPTAGAVMSNMMREFKAEQRKNWIRQYEIRTRMKVYIVSKYAGDTEANVQKALDYCRFAIRKRRIPFASHLFYPQMLDDNVEAEREIGTQYGLAWLSVCDEIWCFGAERSSGMERELQEAQRLDKRIRYFTDEMEEVT